MSKVKAGNRPEKVLVTGGAGYIGAHTVKALSEAGYHVTVFDDLSRGHPEHIPGIPLIIGLMEDDKALMDVLESHEFDAVIHFAGESQAGDSVTKPDKYFRRNIIGGLNLCSAMVRKESTNWYFPHQLQFTVILKKYPLQRNSGEAKEPLWREQGIP